MNEDGSSSTSARFAGLGAISAALVSVAAGVVVGLDRTH